MNSSRLQLSHQRSFAASKSSLDRRSARASTDELKIFGTAGDRAVALQHLIGAARKILEFLEHPLAVGTGAPVSLRNRDQEPGEFFGVAHPPLP